LLKEVMEGEVPKHVAIIMDGNRRFAQEFGLTTTEGPFQRQGQAGRDDAVGAWTWTSRS